MGEQNDIFIQSKAGIDNILDNMYLNLRKIGKGGNCMNVFKIEEP
ncbi:protein of unknown function [Paenibacillus alvei]|uniref:Uncharacterized protein n=1 Tax=Paenibacillus alvei TaxID=44250 RepID=A0A383RFX7_PAEAL|nr:protein of unknown function [Paenibacillus alvei]